MAKNFRIFRKDTKSIPVIKIGKNYLIRFPSFFVPSFFILIGTLAAVILLLPYVTSVQSFDLPKLGEASKETIIAPFTFDIVRSPEELEKERKKAMDQVLLVLDYDSEIKKYVYKKFVDLRSSIIKIGEKNIPDSVKANLRQRLSKELSENSISYLAKKPYIIDDAVFQAGDLLDQGIPSMILVPSTERLSELRSIYNTSFDQNLIYDKQYVTMRRDSLETTLRVSDLPVKEIALEIAVKKIKNERKYDDEALSAIYELLFAYIKPNVKINYKETSERKLNASRDVLETNGKVIKDTEIVRKHQEVTGDIIRKLHSLRFALDKIDNAQEKRKVRAGNAGRLLLYILPLLFMAFYIKNFGTKLVNNNQHLFVYALILVFQIAIIRLGLFLVPRLFNSLGEITALIPEYLIPVTAGSILATILFSTEFGLLVTLFTSIFFGIVMGFNLYFFLYAFFGGIISCLTMRNIRYRRHFFKSIPPVFLLFVIMISLWQIIGYKLSIMSLFQNYGLALINVIISVLLSMMLTPVLERVFDITTDMTLVELSDMNNSILKRLSIEAAGTYNHSVLVGNLAESAAQRIGANALLARVASYYHDIGKIEKSDYFVENCLTTEKNRHVKLAPSMSALIICSHVKDGVELAKKFRVPKVIQDAIMQHHGTSTVSFFYEKALELDPHKQVQEQDFRYPGPVPQTRETAIIMLADSVEAAARSLATSSPKLLRELVKKIIRDKFLAGQLDQCDLTLKDLDEIVEGFMPVLQGIFHSRIEYPTK